MSRKINTFTDICEGMLFSHRDIKNCTIELIKKNNSINTFEVSRKVDNIINETHNNNYTQQKIFSYVKSGHWIFVGRLISDSNIKVGVKVRYNKNFMENPFWANITNSIKTIVKIQKDNIFFDSGGWDSYDNLKINYEIVSKNKKRCIICQK